MEFRLILTLGFVAAAQGSIGCTQAADICPNSGQSKFCCSVAIPDEGATPIEQYQFRDKDSLCYGLVQMPHSASKLVVAGIVQEPALTDKDVGGAVRMSLMPSITDTSLTFYVEGASLDDGSFRLAGDLIAGQIKNWDSSQFKQLQQSLTNFDFIAYLPADATAGRARQVLTPVVLQSAAATSTQRSDVRIVLRSDFAIGDLALSFLPALVGAQPDSGALEQKVTFERKGTRRIVATIPTSGLPPMISLLVRTCDPLATACKAEEQVPDFIDIMLSK